MRKFAVPLFLFLLPVALRADTLQFTLTSPFQTGAAGQTLDFYATLTAPTDNADLVYLDALTINADDGLEADTDDFYNLPLYLAPGETVTDRLFRITLAADLPQTFSLSGLATVQGRYGASASTEDLSSQPFNISAAITTTPEPSSLLLMGSGSIACAWAMARRKRDSQAGATA